MFEAFCYLEEFIVAAVLGHVITENFRGYPLQVLIDGAFDCTSGRFAAWRILPKQLGGDKDAFTSNDTIRITKSNCIYQGRSALLNSPERKLRQDEVYR